MSNKDYTESIYQKKFLSCIAPNEFPKHTFINNFAIEFDSNNILGTARSYEPTMPNIILDFLSIDENGCYHLWEFKKMSCDEYRKMKVLGQLICYQFLFETDNFENIRNKIIKTIGEDNTLTNLLDKQLNFSSINLFLCGGNEDDLFSPILTTIDVKGNDIFDGIFHIYHIDKKFHFES